MGSGVGGFSLRFGSTVGPKISDGPKVFKNMAPVFWWVFGFLGLIRINSWARTSNKLCRTGWLVVKGHIISSTPGPIQRKFRWL